METSTMLLIAAVVIFLVYGYINKDKIVKENATRKEKKPTTSSCSMTNGQSFIDATVRSGAEQKMHSQGIIGGSALHRPQANEIAYQRVMNDVIIDAQTKRKLYKTIFTNETGSTVESHLLVGQWQWPEFERWKEIFLKDGIFPYMWKKYPEICLPSFENLQIKYVLGKMLVKDIKFIFSQLHIDIPQKTNKTELIEIAGEKISIQMLQGCCNELYLSTKEDFLQRVNKGMCAILSHTIFSTSCHLRDYYTNANLKLMPVDNCLVEKKYSKAKGKLSENNLPPFFPGDRTGATFVRKRR